MRFRDLIPFRRKTPSEKKSWTMTMSDGLMNKDWDLGWWQQNLSPSHMAANETVEACVSALAQTASMCPIYHFTEESTGEKSRNWASNAERVLKNPNPYQTRTLFFNVAIRSMYLTGNAYAVATRDSRGAVSRLDLVDPRATRAAFSGYDGKVYYWVSPLNTGPMDMFNSEEDYIVPARNMLHLRLHTTKDPLKGETPITAAASSISASTALTAHQARFFNNMARPSAGLFTDAELKKDQITQLRDAVDAQTKGDNSGKVPIFAHGLKWQSMELSSQDAQMIEAYGMQTEAIARVFRIPLPLINDLRNSTFNNSEAMMAWFLASGLGFLLEHIELELAKLFSMPFADSLNFDTTQLLRSDWKTRIEALGEGVIKGIYSPNEARAKEGLPPALDGDEPRVQQQVVPLSAWDDQQAETAPPVEENDPVEDDEPDMDSLEASLNAGITKGLSNVA